MVSGRKRHGIMYEVPDIKKSIGQDKFEFKIGTKTYAIPRLKLLSTRQMMDLEKLNELEILAFIAPTKAAKDALLDLPIGALEDLMNAWREDSGISLGESEGSPS